MNELSNNLEDLSLSNNLQANLGSELVDILYSNTKLNYDVCAVNLMQVLEHLGEHLPDFKKHSTGLIGSIKVCLKSLK